jgi:hypothetical protein
MLSNRRRSERSPGSPRNRAGDWAEGGLGVSKDVWMVLGWVLGPGESFLSAKLSTTPTPYPKHDDGEALARAEFFRGLACSRLRCLFPSTDSIDPRFYPPSLPLPTTQLRCPSLRGLTTVQPVFGSSSLLNSSINVSSSVDDIGSLAGRCVHHNHFPAIQRMSQLLQSLPNPFLHPVRS